MLDAIGNVDSIWKLAAFALVFGWMVLIALIKPGASLPLNHLPKEHRQATFDKMLEMQRETTKTKYRLAWFVILALVVFIVFIAARAPLAV